MASPAGQIFKILILVFASLTGSVVWGRQRSSDLVAQLQELLKGFDEAEFTPGQHDTAVNDSLIRQLAQEIKELTLSNSAATFNCHCSCPGSRASYLLPAAALVAMGFFYMWWWKGRSFSDLMSMTKQLENVHETLASTRSHLTEELEDLSQKVEEQIKLNQLNANEVSELKSNLSQFGLEFERFYKMISGLDRKLRLAESKQDMTISSVWRLCRIAAEFCKDRNRNTLENYERESTLLSSLLEKSVQNRGIHYPWVCRRFFKPRRLAEKTPVRKQ